MSIKIHNLATRLFLKLDFYIKLSEIVKKNNIKYFKTTKKLKKRKVWGETNLLFVTGPTLIQWCSHAFSTFLGDHILYICYLTVDSLKSFVCDYFAGQQQKKDGHFWCCCYFTQKSWNLKITLSIFSLFSLYNFLLQRLVETNVCSGTIDIIDTEIQLFIRNGIWNSIKF